MLMCPEDESCTRVLTCLDRLEGGTGQALIHEPFQLWLRKTFRT